MGMIEKLRKRSGKPKTWHSLVHDSFCRFMLTFVEAPSFTSNIGEVLSEEEFHRFQLLLASRPDAGDVIPGLRGLRKVRVAASGRGKRGGARVIYLHLPRAEIIFLFAIYTKSDIGDLSPDQKKRLLFAVEAIKLHYEP
jgi:hypothetical protein